MDYRDLPEASFDAVASIGMVEHVGERRSTSTRRRSRECWRREGGC